MTETDTSATPSDDPRQKAFLAQIERHVRETAFLTGVRVLDLRVQAALARVKRDAFVPSAAQDYAWDDRPLPIGQGQTISQPFIVALMSDLLALKGQERVLEIGTGSGYQTAVLAELAQSVYSIERIPALAENARTQLDALGYENIHLRTGNGAEGWPEAAPFDAILVAAAARRIPPVLEEQLAEGGRMVIPIGPPGGGQDLWLLQKKSDGRIKRERILGVAFVPLVETTS